MNTSAARLDTSVPRGESPLDPIVLDNYQLGCNIQFLGKVLKCEIATELQGFLDEEDFLGPLQSVFRSGYGIVALVNALHQELECVLFLLDLSGIQLCYYSGLPSGMFYSGSNPSCRAKVRR